MAQLTIEIPSKIFQNFKYNIINKTLIKIYNYVNLNKSLSKTETVWHINKYSTKKKQKNKYFMISCKHQVTIVCINRSPI